jgi:hypothetical protein
MSYRHESLLGESKNAGLTTAMPSVKVNSIRVKLVGSKEIDKKTLNVKKVKPRSGVKT